MPKKYLDASSVNGEVWKTIHLESRDMQDDNWRAGVFLRSKPNNQRVWIQHVKIEGHKREILIGEFPSVSMAQARKLAATNRELLETGIDIYQRSATTMTVGCVINCRISLNKMTCLTMQLSCKHPQFPSTRIPKVHLTKSFP
jgi:hypothetical protein